MTGKNVQPKPQDNDTGVEGETLTKREREILTWTALGKTYADISIMLSISEDTAKDHVERIGRKLNTMNKTHSAAVAVDLGLIKLVPPGSIKNQ